MNEYLKIVICESVIKLGSFQIVTIKMKIKEIDLRQFFSCQKDRKPLKILRSLLNITNEYQPRFIVQKKF